MKKVLGWWLIIFSSTILLFFAIYFALIIISVLIKSPHADTLINGISSVLLGMVIGLFLAISFLRLGIKIIKNKDNVLKL
ncbi:hypothetical protein [Flavobacterium sp.]|jgi:hypothetical protein|uniref:hypothetical protein n=1 Tax=Flavobacterium sp. TaxID=239 RepID=UPI0037BE8B23